ncbi:Arsenate reductase [Mycolicibacterium aubagnense]
MSPRPSVLFVCVHNAGRSQMAAALLTELSGGRVEVRSAGTAPADALNPVAVAAMTELGIDITAAAPKVLSADTVQSSDVVITMGCGDTCPYFPECPTVTGNSMTRQGSRSRPCAPFATRSPNGCENSSPNCCPAGDRLSWSTLVVVGRVGTTAIGRVLRWGRGMVGHPAVVWSVAGRYEMTP